MRWCGPSQSLRMILAGGNGFRADESEHTLVTLLGGTGGGTLDGLRSLIDGVPENRC